MLLLFKENPLIMKFSLFQIIYRLSIGIIVPFFSLILNQAGWSISEITYFFSLAAFVIFFLGPIIGRVADEIGKKKVIVFGLSIQMIFFLLYYFTIDHIYLTYTIRFFEIVSFICVGVVGIGALEDLIGKRERGFFTGLILGIGTLGSLLGPVLAGYIAQYFEAKVLFLFAVPLTFLSILFILLLPEFKLSNKKFSKSDLNIFSEFSVFLRERKLRGMAIFGILMNSKNQIYAIFFPILIVSQMGYSESVLGYLLALPVFLHIFQFIFGKIGDAISSEFGVILGVFLAAISIFFLPFVKTLPTICFLLVVYGIGSSIWNVNAWALMGEVAKKKHIEGEIVATYSSLSKLGVFISTLVSATLVSILGIEKTLQLFGILILLSMIIVLYFFKPLFHHKKHGSYFDSMK